MVRIKEEVKFERTLSLEDLGVDGKIVLNGSLVGPLYGHLVGRYMVTWWAVIWSLGGPLYGNELFGF